MSPVLLLSALAAPAELGASVLAEFTGDQGPDTGGYGAGVVVTSPLSRWVAVDGRVQLVAGDTGAVLTFFPELRVRVTGGEDDRGSLGLAAGLGARFPSEIVPRGTLAAVADVAVNDRLRIRPEVRYLFSDIAEPGAGQFALGVVWREREAEPAPIPVAAPVVVPEPAPAAPAVSLTPPDARVWVPHPVCRWVPAAEVAALLPQLRPEDRVRVIAAGHLPVETDASHLPGTVLPPAPPQGSVVVVAEPGDLVTVGGQEVRVSADGVAVLNVPQGVITGSVAGGGRVAPVEVAVGDGHAVWVRVPEPRPVRVDFDRGSAELDPAEVELLTQMAGRAGGWMFLVQGSASRDGNPTLNEGFAAARAEAVAAVLRGAGLPADRVVVRSPVVAPVDDPGARFAVVTPIPAGVP